MDIQIGMILFQIVNFGIVLAALWFLLYRPVLKIFAERAKRIEEGQKAASAAIEDHEKIEELKIKTERQIKEKTAAALKEATDDGKKRQAELVAEAKKISQEEIEKLREQWSAEKEAELHKMNQAVVDAVFQVSSVVIPKVLDEKSHAALIDKEVAAVLKQL
ncbi:ATP synthase F0 subunit B [Candidatus Woesebacteria bacterium]|nr:ATP synthase F0 subunit B [Candidatus Woesebacteria bacterium]